MKQVDDVPLFDQFPKENSKKEIRGENKDNADKCPTAREDGSYRFCHICNYNKIRGVNNDR